MPVRVLIVDDQEPFRMAARMVVEATDGFEVVGEAETGEDSVVMARDLAPDLVLMDVNLPGINGLDATRQILADGHGRWSCSCSRPTRRRSTLPSRRVRGFGLRPEGGVRPRPPRAGLGGCHDRVAERRA